MLFILKILYVLNAEHSVKIVGMVLMKCKIACFVLIFSFVVPSCVEKACFEKAKCGAVSLPITSRSFWVGVTPTLSLNGTLEEVYRTAGSVADVMNLWFVNVPWYNTAEHLKKPQTQGLLQLINKSGLTPIFQLNFWTIHNGKVVLQVPPYMDPASTNLGTSELRQLWIEKAVNVSRDYHPKYFCIGNEVDTYYWNCSREDFDNYVSLVSETYDAIKAVSPDTRVLVVFRLDTIDSYNGWFLIEKFDKNKIDIFGFTSYPYMLGYPGPALYEKPSEMPSDYYKRIMNYTGDKQVAFSEIGWTSSALLRGGSEEEQVEFLLWFLEHTKNMPLEFVSWLCLHDIRTVEEETNPNAKPNDFAGLRYKNGTEKAIWTYWQALYAIQTIPESQISWFLPLSLIFAALVVVFIIKRLKVNRIQNRK
ncbi:MAG: glycosyl hydrolase 53 family protein [Candidatus Bathyarchaeia archaeon]